MNKVISREYVEKNYVHKDKILAKIEELEKLNDIDYMGYIEGKITVLEELLGDE